MKKRMLVAFAICIGFVAVSSSCSKDEDTTVIDSNSESNLPTGIVLKNITEGIFIMGSNDLDGSSDQQAAAPEHEVALNEFAMSEAEITNAQYVEFLNAAYAEGLIALVTGATGPDNGKRLIQGTASSSYNGKTLYTLDGIRVLKDHDNSDGDGDSFTGQIEPENPLNISYIGFNESTNLFYVKNPTSIRKLIF